MDSNKAARNRKADAVVAAGSGSDRRIDADDLALEVQERSTGIARVDRGVRLNEILVISNRKRTTLRRLQYPPSRFDRVRKDCQPPRPSRRLRLLSESPNLAALRPVASIRRTAISVFGSAPIDFRRVRLVIAGDDDDFLRTANHMIIRDDEAIVADDDSGALAFLSHGGREAPVRIDLRRRIARILSVCRESRTPRPPSLRACLPNFGFGLNAYDRRT